MLSDLWLLTLGTIVALVLFWSVPGSHPILRQKVLLCVSATLVLLYSPGGFAICLVLIWVPLFSQWVFNRYREASTLWLCIGLALLPLILLRLLTDQPFHISFGAAFATVKSLGLVMTAYAGRQALRSIDVALMIFFFPLFTVGPVEKVGTFFSTKFANRFDPELVFWGGVRIVVGLFLVMFICDDILNPIRQNWYGVVQEDIAGFSRSDAAAFIVISFLYTYLNFEGFSSIAIGLSRLFGLRVMENFDRPLMVTNVAEFWKRYHISMGNWINQFIFFPLVIWLKKSWASSMATVIAFILFGLWHAFDVNYFIWGLGNGLAVAGVHYGTSKKLFPLIKEGEVARRTVGVATGAMTIFYIAWLQTFANLETFEAGLTLTAALISPG